MISMYNRLKTNYEKGGLDTVVQNDSEQYCIFSAVKSDGGIRRSEWRNALEECNEFLGSDYNNKEWIEKESKTDNWKIIKTITRESHYEVGDKVIVKRLNLVAKIEEKSLYGYGYTVSFGGNLFNKEDCDSTELEPYFEEEEMVIIEISKKSLEGIKNYKIVK